MYGRMGGTTLLSVPGVRVILRYLLGLIGVYPVTYYGVVAGGGSSNAASNTAALQALWTTVASAGGGIIFFPRGSYAFNATTLDHNLGYGVSINMLGSNGASVLEFYGTSGPFLDVASNAASTIARCYMRDLRFQHANVPTVGATLQFTNVAHMVFLEHIRIVNVGNGLGAINTVRLAGTGMVSFRNCKFETRADITQLSFDGLTPIGLDVASSSLIGGLFMDYVDWGGCRDGGATISGGAVTGVTVSAVGSGYTSPPTVTFSGGGGSGAAGTAVLTSGKVTGVTITNGGSGYTSAPTVTFSGGGGSGAAAAPTSVGYGIRFANSGSLDTVWFGPGTLIKDWAVGIYKSIGAGGVGNVLAHGLIVDAIQSVCMQIEPPTSSGIGTWHFSGCWFSSLGYNVILGESGGGVIENFSFNNCYMTDAQIAALAIGSGVDNVLLVGNQIASVAGAGEWVVDVNGTNADILIANNRIAAPAAAAGLIRIGASVSPVVVTGNILRGGSDADGISFGGSTGPARVNANNAYAA